MIVDISADVDSLLIKLGVENKALVQRITIDTSIVTLTVYQQDADGFKTVDPVAGVPLTTITTYDVTT